MAKHDFQNKVKNIHGQMTTELCLVQSWWKRAEWR